MHIPRGLRTHLARHTAIAFAGAGVSMAVRDRHTSRPLFPSWRELLNTAADRLEEEGKPRYGARVRALLAGDAPAYLAAAQEARSGLGGVWFTFLREQLSPERERADHESLALARSLWDLGSNLLVTTNYDRVLQWACSPELDCIPWSSTSPAELAGMFREGLRDRTVWHLHGHIDNAATLILTPDGYSRMYQSGDTEHGYAAAIRSLDILQATRAFLFVGFSMDDPYVGAQFRGLDRVFAGASGPHYVVAHQSDRERIERLGLPVEVITFPGFGDPLLSLMHEFGRIAAGRGSVVSPITAATAESEAGPLPLDPSMSTPIEVPEPPSLKDARYNIAIIGKTGVGKSALFNYLFGEHVRQVNVGPPVTRKGFHQHPFQLGDIPATLFDSWGLEVGTAVEWLAELEGELRSRGTDKPAQDWFHTIFYCVAAGGSRFESFEAGIVRRLLADKYNVVVVLTKADQASEEDTDTLIASIRAQVGTDVPCVPVCSEEKKMVWGTTKRFGMEELVRRIHLGFWTSISQRLPDRCISVLMAMIDRWYWDQQELIDLSIGFNHLRIHQAIKANAEQLAKALTGTAVADIVVAEFQSAARFSQQLSQQLIAAESIHLPETRDVFPGATFLATSNTLRTALTLFAAVGPSVLVGLAIPILPIGSQYLLVKELDKFTSELQSGVERYRASIREALEQTWQETGMGAPRRLGRGE